MHYTPLKTDYTITGKIFGVIMTEDNTELVWEYGYGNLINYDAVMDRLDSMPVPAGWMVML